MGQRGLITTETIAAYRARLDESGRKLTFIEQELASLRTTVDSLLSAATASLSKGRAQSSAYGTDQRADWTLLIAQRQARMMAELNDHVVEPWWRVHGRVYYKTEEYRDLNGWLLGSSKLVFSGPYPNWRVEIPAHPDKQGPGGDGRLQCSESGAGIVPCKQRAVQGAKAVSKCPDSEVISVTARNSYTRSRAIRAYWQKTLTQDCPETWNTKTSNGRVLPQPQPHSVEGLGIVFRLGTGAKLTFYVPCQLIKGG